MNFSSHWKAFAFHSNTESTDEARHQWFAHLNQALRSEVNLLEGLGRGPFQYSSATLRAIRDFLAEMAQPKDVNRTRALPDESDVLHKVSSLRDDVLNWLSSNRPDLVLRYLVMWRLTMTDSPVNTEVDSLLSQAFVVRVATYPEDACHAVNALRRHLTRCGTWPNTINAEEKTTLSAHIARGIHLLNQHVPQWAQAAQRPIDWDPRDGFSW